MSCLLITVKGFAFKDIQRRFLAICGTVAVNLSRRNPVVQEDVPTMPYAFRPRIPASRPSAASALRPKKLSSEGLHDPRNAYELAAHLEEIQLMETPEGPILTSDFRPH